MIFPMTHRQQHDTLSGLFWGLGAYAFWGLTPLYFRALRTVAPLEVLAHRTIWSAVLLATVLSALGRWPDLARCLRSRRLTVLLVTSSLLLTVNWLVYIYAIASGHVLQASLGYFVNPLFTVLLGTLVLRERLRWGQWAALALATAGLLYLVVALAELPWIALALAGSFSLYGLTRKLAAVDPLIGLSAETLAVLPGAAVFLGGTMLAGTASFGQGFGGQVDGLLLLSGAVTAVPLLLFGLAVRRLRLVTLGFLQYLTPSIQFLLALAVFGEAFAPAQQVSFGCIWAALLLFSVEAIVSQRRQAPQPAPQRLPQGPPSANRPLTPLTRSMS
jgi:chloramphenicol-sensitive protein RarD